MCIALIEIAHRTHDLHKITLAIGRAIAGEETMR